MSKALYQDRIPVMRNGLERWWFHFKMRNIGNKRYEKKGGGVIPCEWCGSPFQSYPHYSGGWFIYDNLCEWCSFANRDPTLVKLNLEMCLNEFDRGERDWRETKQYLRTEGINVGCEDDNCKTERQTRKR